jgi:hypothetical protein
MASDTAASGEGSPDSLALPVMLFLLEPEYFAPVDHFTSKRRQHTINGKVLMLQTDSRSSSCV